MLMTGARRAVKVPFLDLRPVHEPLKAGILADIAELIDSVGVHERPRPCAEFETAFARFCGTRECVGVASGLDALRLGLLAAGIEPGDEVIVPAHTFVATFEAVTQAGGVPVPVDVGEDDYNLDVAAVEAAVGPATRFVLPVHLYGQLADMRRLQRRRRRARADDRRGRVPGPRRASATGSGPGRRARAAAFSFYPGKNLGAMGDAGALVTDDDRPRRTACARCASTASGPSTCTTSRATRPGSTRSRRSCSPASCRCSTAGTRSAARIAARLRRAACAGSATSRSRRSPEGSDARLAPLRRPHRATRRRSAASCGRAASRTGRHYPQPPHLSPA